MHLSRLSSAFLCCAVLAEKDRPVLSNISVNLPTGFHYSELAPWLSEFSINADSSDSIKERILAISIEKPDTINPTTFKLKAQVNSEVAAIIAKPDERKYSINILENDAELDVQLNDQIVLIHPIPSGLKHTLKLMGDETFVNDIIRVMAMNKTSSRVVFAAQIMNINSARNNYQGYRFVGQPNPPYPKKKKALVIYGDL